MKLANGLKTAVEIPMALLAAFLLFMGIGEMVGGDSSGLGHLLPAAVLGLLMWFAWKRPLFAGIILVLAGIVNSIPYLIAANPSHDWYLPVLLISIPLLLSGLLLLLAARKTLKAAV